MTDREIFERDMDWLSSSGFVVAEVTSASLGVGFEIASALAMQKKVLCLYRVKEGKRLSAMIAGCPGLEVREYSQLEEIGAVLEKFFRG